MNAPVNTQTPVLMNNAQTSALVLDPQSMQNMVAFAEFMCKAVITVPKHLQGNSGDCLAVTMQAMQWGMNPFAVAQKTHLVNGNLGYEAQLVNAVIIARAPITSRPDYEWYGDWSKVDGKTCKAADIGVRVSVMLKGETNVRVLDVSFAQVGTTRNSPNWANDPKQQIAYLAIKKLARLHFPDVILGVYTDDELNDHSEFIPSERTVSGAAQEGYAAFEALHLPHLNNEAQYGTERLQQAYTVLPKSEFKKTLWTTHSASLKEIAQFADQALAREGETYEHSPA
ncbi:single-stranded DNA-binding protein [Acinetobacter radioresistens]|uniref:RecT family recombinase n=1 Tax=Acinetobacter radioresistens TaxID=40216 RepID=UPI000F797136|nr:RecT family recombinase [Acinetobacter radioresistens]RSO70099.1 single-stranded DNA-binding protein [Acinetobacter radioresistens]